MRAAGSRGSELANALTQWEQRARRLRVAQSSLERMQAGLARTREDVADCWRELLEAATLQGRAEAMRVRVPRDAKREKSQLKALAWMQAREAERVRDAAVMAAVCGVLLEQEAQAAERVAGARCGSVVTEASAAWLRYLERGKRADDAADDAADDVVPL